MRCLWISRYLPYPLDAGAKVYSAQLALALAHTGAYVRVLGYGSADAVPPEARSIDWISVPADRRKAVTALASHLPIAAAIDATRAYRTLLQQQLREAWDVIVFDGYGTGWALERCIAYRRHARNTVLVHVSHNHESVLWAAMARDARLPWIKRVALWSNARKVARLENALVRHTDLLTTITAEDRALLGGELSSDCVVTLTPGYDGPLVRTRSIDADTPRRVLIVGSFRWIVKQENLTRFVELADPVLHRSGIELHVVGDVPDELRAQLEPRCHATVFHGFVSDLTAIAASARIAIVPEHIGGGFKLKFLDYMFARVPVATLTQATSGLPPELRTHTLQRETLADLAYALPEYIDRLDALNRLQNGAFDVAQSLFRWSDRGSELRKAIARAHDERASTDPQAESVSAFAIEPTHL
ncbi:MAG: glycosyltransferase [Steroidobacteraceae bacterium]